MRYFVTLLFAALSFNTVGQIQSDFPYNLDAENNESSFHKSQWVNLILGDISYESAFGHKRFDFLLHYVQKETSACV
jgi:hypothetical protein